MYRIGLTGGVGSGKSTVSNYMHTLGIPVIDGDKLAREAVTPGSQAMANGSIDDLPAQRTAVPDWQLRGRGDRMMTRRER